MYDDLTEAFRSMAHCHRNALRAELARYGLYLGQHRILFLLKKHPGLSQVEICEELGVSKESLSLSLKRLYNAALVIYVKDTADRRKTLWSLTDLGLQRSKACEHGFHSVNAAMFAGFSDEEVDQLNAYFNRMIDGLEKRCIDEKTI